MATQNNINLPTGTTGQVLGATTGSMGTFITSLAADFTFTSTTAGETRKLTASNTDNSNTASAAKLAVTTGGSSAGDAAMKFTVTGVTNFSVGCDNSSLDRFVISGSTTLGTTNVRTSTVAGELTQPLTPAFLGIAASPISNATGDGTAVSIVLGTVAFDQNNDFDGVSTFTAPVDGRYNLGYSVLFSAIGVANTSGLQSLITSNRSYSSGYLSYTAVRVTNGNVFQFSHAPSVTADMDAADTAYISVQISGGTKTIGIGSGSSTDLRTWFYGYLLA